MGYRGIHIGWMLTDGRYPHPPGGIVEMTGSKIRSVNADGTSIGKVVLVNTETQAETDITSLAINDPSRQMFSIPASLPEGTYKLKVETYFSTNNQRLKSVRTIEYDHDLVVGTLTSGGGQTTNPGGSEITYIVHVDRIMYQTGRYGRIDWVDIVVLIGTI